MAEIHGQVAYEAYMAVLYLSFPVEFAALPDIYRRAWEDAAQAVLDARKDAPPTPGMPDPARD